MISSFLPIILAQGPHSVKLWGFYFVCISCKIKSVMDSDLIHRPEQKILELPPGGSNRNKILIAAGAVVVVFLISYFFIFKQDIMAPLQAPAVKTLGGVIAAIEDDRIFISATSGKRESFYTVNISKKTKILKTDAGTVPPYLREADFKFLTVGSNVIVSYQESDKEIEAQKVEVINFPLPPKEVMERTSPNQTPPPPPK